LASGASTSKSTLGWVPAGRDGHCGSQRSPAGFYSRDAKLVWSTSAFDPFRSLTTGSLVVVELVEDYGHHDQDNRHNNKTCASRTTVILAQALVHFIV
jgi:hypothetical protein